jgi:glutathione S-transferase
MPTDPETPKLFGRSSSHFTRITRIFAAEYGVPYELHVVRDLLSETADDYGGNPALRLPNLISKTGTWFGSLNVCRELARSSSRALRTVWPEDTAHPTVANAQELVLQGMATEVSLLLAKTVGVPDNAQLGKHRQSLLASLAWLEAHVETARAALAPDRHLAYFEVSLFCFLTHLPFRQVLTLEPYPALLSYTQSFAERPSALATEYHFDT